MQLGITHSSDRTSTPRSQRLSERRERYTKTKSESISPRSESTFFAAPSQTPSHDGSSRQSHASATPTRLSNSPNLGSLLPSYITCVGGDPLIRSRRTPSPCSDGSPCRLPVPSADVASVATFESPTSTRAHRSPTHPLCQPCGSHDMVLPCCGSFLVGAYDCFSEVTLQTIGVPPRLCDAPFARPDACEATVSSSQTTLFAPTVLLGTADSAVGSNDPTTPGLSSFDFNSVGGGVSPSQLTDSQYHRHFDEERDEMMHQLRLCRREQERQANLLLELRDLVATNTALSATQNRVAVSGNSAGRGSRVARKLHLVWLILFSMPTKMAVRLLSLMIRRLAVSRLFAV